MMPYEHVGLQRIQTISSDAYQACQFRTLLAIQPRNDDANNAVADVFRRFGSWSDKAELSAFASYPLTVTCQLEDEAIDIEFVFDEGFISRRNAEASMQRFGHVIGQLAASGVQDLVANVEVLPPVEYSEPKLGGVGMPQVANGPPYASIEHQAITNPHGMAVQSQDGALTYVEFIDYTNRLVDYLTEQGVSAGVQVPLFFGESRWMVVALLAVLRVGGVAIPLDSPLKALSFHERNPVQTSTQVILTSDQNAALLSRSTHIIIPVGLESLARLVKPATNNDERTSSAILETSLSSVVSTKLHSYTSAKEPPPLTKTQTVLRDVWARVLNIRPANIGINDSFFHLGGDSITAMQISSATRESLGHIPTADILRKQTIFRLAASLDEMIRNQPPLDLLAPDVVGDSFSLSPIQQFHLSLNPNPRQHVFDQCFHLELHTPVSLESLSNALTELVHRQPMLRARLTEVAPNTWEQRVVPDVAGSFRVWAAEKRENISLWQADAMRQCRESLNMEHGPVLSAVLFETSVPSTLFLSAHHMIIDLVSWRILLEDLECLLKQNQLQAPSISFQTWCSLQAQYASDKLVPQLPDGLELEPAPVDYWGLSSADNVIGVTKTIQFRLDETVSSALLGPCNASFETRPVELFISALVHAFTTAFPGRASPSVISEGHGRETWDDRIDITRTVGWFTTLFPVHMGRNSSDASVIDTIRQTKDFMRALPGNGWQWFTSRFSNAPNAVAYSSQFPVEIAFNYIGPFGQLERDDASFRMLPVPGCAPSSSHDIRRFAIFDVAITVRDSQLTVSLTYPGLPQHQGRLASWMEEYRSTLINLAGELPTLGRRLTLETLSSAFDSYDDLDQFQDILLQAYGITNLEEVEDIYPCTPMERSILAVQEQDDRNYRVVLNFVLSTEHAQYGSLSVQIERAWKAVTRRHPLLRGIIVGGVRGPHRPVHVILQDPQPNIRVSQNNSIPPQTSDAINYYRRDGLQYCLTICQTTDMQAQLRLEISHAILDGRSSQILMRDLQVAFCGNLDGTCLSHGEYAKYVTKRRYEADLAFWAERLSKTQPCLYPRSSLSGSGSGTFSVDVTRVELGDTVHKFCRRHELAPATVLQLAWALVLHKLISCSTPCFGIITSGRDAPLPGIQDIVGALMGLVICQVALDDGKSIMQTLREIQGDYLDCLPHQSCPMMDISDALQLNGDALFNTALSIQSSSLSTPDAESYQLLRFQGGEDPVEYDIYVRVQDYGTGIDIALTFWEDRTSRREGEIVAAAFGEAIHFVCADPNHTPRGLSFSLESITSDS
ncbi:hypothetical protein F4808DRAFT_414508 [Astrocystis sublimbata]|nr:hypothetical protein F4808DRAFT_414508 [Astrocystis sublimbata]